MTRKILAALFALTFTLGLVTVQDAAPAEAHGVHYNAYDVCRYSARAQGYVDAGYYVYQARAFHYGDAHVYQCWLNTWDGWYTVCAQQVSNAWGGWISGFTPYFVGRQWDSCW